MWRDKYRDARPGSAPRHVDSEGTTVSSSFSIGCLCAGLAAGVLCTVTAGCGSTPGAPAAMLAVGRWAATGACLSVAEAGCDLVIGCGHGQFPRPTIGSDGTFTIDGTYRVEVGPTSVNPAPPAHFLGTTIGGTLSITVVPSDPSVKPATYSLQLTNDANRCTVPCV